MPCAVGNGAASSNGSSDAQPSSSAAEGQLPKTEAPAFLLVHGFGAFGEQWRGQIKALTAAGYQVTDTDLESRLCCLMLEPSFLAMLSVTACSLCLLRHLHVIIAVTVCY